jgi:sulfur-oxidizing protein SoxZ
LVEPMKRVQVQSAAAKGEIVKVRTLINHQMETGLRHDKLGQTIPRDIINKFTCRYNDRPVFSVTLHEAVAENPYFEFFLRATESGRLEFLWEEDGGAVYRLESTLTVA